MTASSQGTEDIFSQFWHCSFMPVFLTKQAYTPYTASIIVHSLL